MRMMRSIENKSARSKALRNIDTDGRIQKRQHPVNIEMKKYKISEISALKKKYAKVDVELSLDDEKDSGRSIMINVRPLRSIGKLRPN